MTAPVPQPPANPPTPDPPTPPPAPADPVPPVPPRDDRGYPADTPLTEMTVEQREAYWKHQARRHEKTVKDRSDYDELKAKAADADKLRKERETETQKQIREAGEKARADALAESTPRLVQAEFRAAAGGRIDAERLATLTEDIDLGRYVRADGSVDLDKVAAKVAAWAPPKDDPRTVKPDPTQGARNTKTTGTDVGREMFDARRRRKPAA